MCLRYAFTRQRVVDVGAPAADRSEEASVVRVAHAEDWTSQNDNRSA